ncbi:MAG TPA: hypothetical protein VFP68_22910 [Burkholderiaceae bacterium]|nr:hypothetical protein [Burkholderiaceae bacterium]
MMLVFVVVLAAPVWIAGKLVGAEHPTLINSVLALIAGTIACFVLAMVVGPFVFLLAPVAFLAAFMLVLGTSFLGAVLLAILSGLGYWLLALWLLRGLAPGMPGVQTI